MYQRVVRAKRKITAAGIPYRVPSADELPERLGAVLHVVHLIYTEGHVATAGDAAGAGRSVLGGDPAVPAAGRTAPR